MRLIDADALDIDNLNRAYNDNFELDFGRLYTTDVIDMIANAPTINAILIPDNATNGDVIKAVFPDIESRLDEKTEVMLVKWANGIMQCIKASWWNAPYKADQEVEE